MSPSGLAGGSGLSVPSSLALGFSGGVVVSPSALAGGSGLLVSSVALSGLSGFSALVTVIVSDVTDVTFVFRRLCVCFLL